jgi:hypothetical protein
MVKKKEIRQSAAKQPEMVEGSEASKTYKNRHKTEVSLKWGASYKKDEDDDMVQT